MADANGSGTGGRILLSNDDGIAAPGFRTLEAVAAQLSDEVWVCAPETEQSGASHSLTIHRPLRLRQQGERRFAVDGTPTDCVLLAVNHMMDGQKPDLMLSGINHGFNIGEDVTYSGTVAAAMEATLLGIRAVALSQEMREGRADWETPLRWAPEVIRKVMAIEWPRGVLVNVNFPACAPDEVKGVRVVRHGNRKIGDELLERVDPRGRTYFWIGTSRGDKDVPEDTDVHVLSQGYISVTPLHLDLTDYPTIDALTQTLA